MPKLKCWHLYTGAKLVLLQNNVDMRTDSQMCGLQRCYKATNFSGLKQNFKFKPAKSPKDKILRKVRSWHKVFSAAF